MSQPRSVTAPAAGGSRADSGQRADDPRRRDRPDLAGHARERQTRRQPGLRALSIADLGRHRLAFSNAVDQSTVDGRRSDPDRTSTVDCRLLTLFLGFSPEQLRHLLLEEVDLVLRLAEEAHELQVLPLDGAAVHDPGRARGELLVQLDDLAVGHEDVVLAHERSSGAGAARGGGPPLKKRSRSRTSFPVDGRAPPEHVGQVARCALRKSTSDAWFFGPRLLVEVLVRLRGEARVEELGEVLVLAPNGTRPSRQKRSFSAASSDCSGTSFVAARRILRRTGTGRPSWVELALVDDREQRDQDRRVRLEYLVEEDEASARQLALIATDVSALAKEVDVDRAQDLRGLREA